MSTSPDGANVSPPVHSMPQMPQMHSQMPQMGQMPQMHPQMMFGQHMNPMAMFASNPAHFAMSPMMNHSVIDFMHPKTVTFECCLPNCDKKFTKTRHLYKHLKTEHHTKFDCPYCGKKSNCMANFVSHCRTHTNEKPWPCPLPSCTYRGRNKNHSKCHVIQNHGVEILQNFESFFMQDRLSATTGRKRNGAKLFGAPKSLMKRQKLNPYQMGMGQMPSLPPMVAPSVMPQTMAEPVKMEMAPMTPQISTILK